jgi:hypothetical protein
MEKRSQLLTSLRLLSLVPIAAGAVMAMGAAAPIRRS